MAATHEIGGRRRVTVRFEGKQVDPVALWSKHGVEFPANFDDDGTQEFSPLVVCPNPKHQTSKKHFQINLRKPLVHCFAGCGISGSYEDALAMVEGITNRAARKEILKHSRVGVGAPRVRKKTALTLVPPVTEYDRYLPPVAVEYLNSRRISSKQIEKWELGWDHDDLRIVLPAKDSRGRIRFLIRRTVKPKVEPRYLYPKESERNKVLYGACHIDPGMVRSHGLLLVEGSIDVIVQDSHEILPVGGILGSKLSLRQANFIMNLRPAAIYCMFDADLAGIRATISVKQRTSGIPVRVCKYPKGKDDPAKLTKEESQKSIMRSLDFTTWSRRAGIYVPKFPSNSKERKSVG